MSCTQSVSAVAELEDAFEECSSSDEESSRESGSSDSESDISIDDIITDLGGGLSLMEKYPVLLNDTAPVGNARGILLSVAFVCLNLHITIAFDIASVQSDTCLMLLGMHVCWKQWSCWAQYDMCLPCSTLAVAPWPPKFAYPCINCIYLLRKA